MTTINPTPLADAYRLQPRTPLPDDLTPDARQAAEAQTDRQRVIDALHNLAWMLKDNPDLPTPYTVAAQAGPLSGDPDEQRAQVVRAAAVLREPLDRDNAERASVRVRFDGGVYGGVVSYVVHADLKPTDEESAR